MHAGRQRDRAGNTGAGSSGFDHNILDGLVQQSVIKRFEPDSYFIHYLSSTFLIFELP